jgi:glycine C-acetyltransferase
MGSFSKTFASNGGFIACRNRAIKEYLRYYSPSATFSNALSQAQAAVVLKAFEIVESAEGAALRSALMTNIVDLRAKLTAKGLEFYGDPSAIVAVKVGSEQLGRRISRRLPKLGLLANLVEYPAVAKGAARFRMQVMAKHTPENIADAVTRLHTGFLEASSEHEFAQQVLIEAVA